MNLISCTKSIAPRLICTIVPQISLRIECNIYEILNMLRERFPKLVRSILRYLIQSNKKQTFYLVNNDMIIAAFETMLKIAALC